MAQQDTTRYSIFPKGKPASAENFTGSVWLNILVPDDSIFHFVSGSVTFAPGVRGQWHSHPAGHILLVTFVNCYYQEKGKLIQVLHKRDIIKSAASVIP